MFKCLATYHNNKTVKRGGCLLIDSSKILFKPHFIEKIILAKEITILKKDIIEHEIVSHELSGNQFLIIKTNEMEYKFFVTNAEKCVLYIKDNNCKNEKSIISETKNRNVQSFIPKALK